VPNGNSPMRELGYWSQLSTDARAELLARGKAPLGISAELRAQVGMLIDDVQARGDRALLAALERFDSCAITADELRVNSADIGRACDNLAPGLKEAIAEGIMRIRRFNEKLTAEREWSFISEPGLRLGEKLTPIESVGLFIPGGKAVYPSVLMQLGTAAVVAGVEKIAVAIPPIPGTGGAMDSAVLFVAKELGIDEIYRVNGPAGVAALGFGTETLPHVRMVIGPGSPAVICAQLEMQRFGCATVMLMGPSESMILADSGADSRLIAADLLNEAEHGPDSASILLTDSETLLEAVQVEATRQIDRLPEPRRAYAMASLGKNGGAILVGDMQQGVDVVNEYAASSRHFTDDVHHFRLTGPFAAFVDDRKRRVDAFCESPGAHDAADVGRDDADFVLGDMQRVERQPAPQIMRLLGRGVERVAVGRRIVFAQIGARLERIGGEPAVVQVERDDFGGLPHCLHRRVE